MLLGRPGFGITPPFRNSFPFLTAIIFKFNIKFTASIDTSSPQYVVSTVTYVFKFLIFILSIVLGSLGFISTKSSIKENGLYCCISAGNSSVIL